MSLDLPVVLPLPAGLMTLDDHATHAQSVLDANAWAYFSGGAGDEITLRANRESWSAQRLLPRVLRPLAGGHTRSTLLGREMQHPMLIAPMAYQKLAHPDGELATAHAAGALGGGLILSYQASMPMEDVATAMRGQPERGPLWFQLHFPADRGYLLELVARAEAAGYEALVTTVDSPVQGVRDRERRIGFALPPGVRAVNLRPHLVPPRANTGAMGSALFDELLRHAPTWADIEWLRMRTRLPLLLKGVLHPDDARRALASGCAGVIVSNHGGRTLDGAVTTARALPSVVQAVAGAIPVLVDGGIRRGTDVLKALALGASAVLVGRPAVYGLANAGAVGVAHVIRLLRDELEAAMALCGCATVEQVTSALLVDGN